MNVIDVIGKMLCRILKILKFVSKNDIVVSVFKLFGSYAYILLFIYVSSMTFKQKKSPFQDGDFVPKYGMLILRFQFFYSGIQILNRSFQSLNSRAQTSGCIVDCGIQSPDRSFQSLNSRA